MSEVNLSKAVRSNLLSLQATAAQMGKTQERLATGNKVNSALDNPSSFFTASGLNSRASDLSNLMDSMSTGIQTIEAANNGITAITKVVENMQSLVRQARADKSATATTPGAAVVGVNATPNSSTSSNNAMSFDIGGGVTISIETHDGTSASSISSIASAINSNSQLTGKVSAEVTTGGQLSLKNLTTSAIGVTGFTAADSVTGDSSDTVSLAAGSGGGISDVRKSLMNQFNDLRGELDRLAQDAGFNGINLLNGDALKLDFNENGTSSITVKGKNADGSDFGALGSSKLSIASQGTSDFNSDSALDSLTSTLQSALGTLRTQAAAYGSNLTTVQNRQDFTKSMINTLQTGASNLTLADTNEEAANLLALQTRQQLASTSLSMASQSDQAVLRLF